MSTPYLPNGVRTYRPNLSEYTYATDQIAHEITRWLEGVPTGKTTRNLMLSGPTGLGKTTLALALCTELGVQLRDVSEINCANLRGIDAARTLIHSTLSFGPTTGNYRVLLLDEAHQMTPDAQQAFLTPLEQLSDKHIVIVCTSNPEFLLPAFLGRFYQIKLDVYPEEKIVDILMNLPEPPTPEQAVLAAQLSRGNPRGAISYIERGLTAQDSEQLAQEVYRLENFITALVLKPNPIVAIQALNSLRQDQTVAFVNQVSLYLENLWLKQNNARLMLPPDIRKIVDQYTRPEPRFSRHGSWLYEQLQAGVFKHPNHFKGIMMRYFDLPV